MVAEAPLVVSREAVAVVVAVADPASVDPVASPEEEVVAAVASVEEEAAEEVAVVSAVVASAAAVVSAEAVLEAEDVVGSAEAAGNRSSASLAGLSRSAALCFSFLSKGSCGHEKAKAFRDTFVCNSFFLGHKIPGWMTRSLSCSRC